MKKLQQLHDRAALAISPVALVIALVNIKPDKSKAPGAVGLVSWTAGESGVVAATPSDAGPGWTAQPPSSAASRRAPAGATPRCRRLDLIACPLALAGVPANAPSCMLTQNADKRLPPRRPDAVTGHVDHPVPPSWCGPPQWRGRITTDARERAEVASPWRFSSARLSPPTPARSPGSPRRCRAPGGPSRRGGSRSSGRQR